MTADKLCLVVGFEVDDIDSVDNDGQLQRVIASWVVVHNCWLVVGSWRLFNVF